MPKVTNKTPRNYVVSCRLNPNEFATVEMWAKHLNVTRDEVVRRMMFGEEVRSELVTPSA